MIPPFVIGLVILPLLRRLVTLAALASACGGLLYVVTQ